MGSLTHIPVASCPRRHQPPFQLFLPFSPLSLSLVFSHPRELFCIGSRRVTSERTPRSSRRCSPSRELAPKRISWSRLCSVLLYSRIDVTSRLFSASENSLEQVLASFLNEFSTGVKKLALVTLCVSLDLRSFLGGFFLSLLFEIISRFSR